MKDILVGLVLLLILAGVISYGITLVKKHVTRLSKILSEASKPSEGMQRENKKQR